MPERTARFGALLVLLACGLYAVGTGRVYARAAQPPTPALEAGAEALPRNIINRYCVTCHNGRLKTAGLELDSLDLARVPDHAAQWEKVVTKFRTGEMPPSGRPRPDAATYATVAS